MFDVTVTCPDGSFPAQTGNDLWWDVTPQDQKEGDPSSDVLQGSVTHGPGDCGCISDYTWSFSPQE
jgi:hypothetical protein